MLNFRPWRKNKVRATSGSRSVDIGKFLDPASQRKAVERAAKESARDQLELLEEYRETVKGNAR